MTDNNLVMFQTSDGKVSIEVFRKIQDQKYVSDFDKEIKKLLKSESSK